MAIQTNITVKVNKKELEDLKKSLKETQSEEKKLTEELSKQNKEKEELIKKVDRLNKAIKNSLKVNKDLKLDLSLQRKAYFDMQKEVKSLSELTKGLMNKNKNLEKILNAQKKYSEKRRREFLKTIRAQEKLISGARNNLDFTIEEINILKNLIKLKEKKGKLTKEEQEQLKYNEEYLKNSGAILTKILYTQKAISNAQAKMYRIVPGSILKGDKEKALNIVNSKEFHKEINKINTDLIMLKRKSIATFHKIAESAKKSINPSKWFSFYGAVKLIAGAYLIKNLMSYIINLGKSIIMTAAKFETFEITLSSLLGGADKAKQALDMLKNVSMEIPDNISDTIAAFRKMKAYGLNASKETIKTYSDVASAMGKRTIDFVEAVADAVNNEYERMKEFNIKMKTLGDKVQLRFVDREGLVKVLEVENSVKSIQKAIEQVSKYKFGGTSLQIMDTLAGRIETIKTKWQLFIVNLNKSSFGDSVKFALSGIANYLDKIGNSKEKLNEIGTTIKSIARMFLSGIKALLLLPSYFNSISLSIESFFLTIYEGVVKTKAGLASIAAFGKDQLKVDIEERKELERIKKIREEINKGLANSSKDREQLNKTYKKIANALESGAKAQKVSVQVMKKQYADYVKSVEEMNKKSIKKQKESILSFENWKKKVQSHSLKDIDGTIMTSKEAKEKALFSKRLEASLELNRKILKLTNDLEYKREVSYEKFTQEYIKRVKSKLYKEVQLNKWAKLEVAKIEENYLKEKEQKEKESLDKLRTMQNSYIAFKISLFNLLGQKEKAFNLSLQKELRDLIEKGIKSSDLKIYEEAKRAEYAKKEKENEERILKDKIEKEKAYEDARIKLYTLFGQKRKVFEINLNREIEDLRNKGIKEPELKIYKAKREKDFSENEKLDALRKQQSIYSKLGERKNAFLVQEELKERELLKLGIEKSKVEAKIAKDKEKFLKEYNRGLLEEKARLDNFAGGWARISIIMKDSFLSLADVMEKSFQGMLSLTDRLSGSFFTAISKGKSGIKSMKDAFKDFAVSALIDLGKMISKQLLLNSLSLLTGGGAGGFFATLFGNGGAFNKGVQFYAKGDVFDQPTAFNNGGGGLGILVESDPEAIVPLDRRNDGKLGIKAQSPVVNLIVNNNAPGIEIRQKVDKKGNIELFIEQAVQKVAKDIQSGTGVVSDSLNAAYAINRR